MNKSFKHTGRADKLSSEYNLFNKAPYSSYLLKSVPLTKLLSPSQYLVNGVEKQVSLFLDKIPVSQQSSKSFPQAAVRMPKKSKFFSDNQYREEGGKNSTAHLRHEQRK